VGPRSILDAVEKRKFPRTCWESNLCSSFIQAIAHMLYQLSCSSCHKSECKMKERILDKYMVSGGRLLCIVVTLDSIKTRNFLTRGK